MIQIYKNETKKVWIFFNFQPNALLMIDEMKKIEWLILIRTYTLIRVK